MVIGDTHISCLHLEDGARIPAPSTTHAATLLVVHGRITMSTHTPNSKIQIHAGMGVVLDRHEPYSMESDTGGIVRAVVAETLPAHARGISTPELIAGQRWADDGALSNCPNVAVRGG